MAIIACSCEHKSQDRLNGKGKRVMNWSAKKESYGCTVCGKRHGRK